MMKEIGSIFPLNDNDISLAEKGAVVLPDDRIYYSLCREALYDIAISLQHTDKRVLVPAYTCQTVITPFEEAGWTCHYYSIQNNLRIDVVSLIELVNHHHPSMVVVHPYFGMDLNDDEKKALLLIHDEGVKVVLDLTQCLFSKHDASFADYVVASYRKWYPIPDGGYLIQSKGTQDILQPKEENIEFTDLETSAMYLRGQYFGNGQQRTKAISIRLSKSADYLAESDITPHRMSHVAYNLLQLQDKVQNQQARIQNYTYLFEHIHDNAKVKRVCTNLAEVTTAPLYFTIYVQDRPALQRQLAQNAIYAPVIWPVENNKVLINDEVKYIYEHLLAIPCDQRYDFSDMQRAIDIINVF